MHHSTIDVQIDSEATQWVQGWLRREFEKRAVGTPKELQFSLEDLPSFASFRVRAHTKDLVGFTLRGLLLNKDYEKGEKILRIPYEMFVCAATVLSKHFPVLLDTLQEDCFLQAPYQEALNNAAPARTYGCSSTSGVADQEQSDQAHGRAGFGGSDIRGATEFIPASRNLAASNGNRSGAGASVVSDAPLSCLSDQLVADQEFVLSCFLIVARFGNQTKATPSPLLLLELDESIQRFVAMMPSVDELPILALMKPDDIRFLGSPEREAKVLRYQKKLRTKFSALQKIVFKQNEKFFVPELFTFENWVWACAIQSSRSFSYSVERSSDQYPVCFLADDEEEETAEAEDEAEGDEEEEDEGGDEGAESDGDGADKEETQVASASEAGTGKSTSALIDLYTMVPFADMANHSEYGCHDFEFNRATKTLDITATRNMLKGEQLFIRYNSNTHWRFAKYYGFIPAFGEKEENHLAANANGGNVDLPSVVGKDPLAAFDNPTDQVPFTVPIPAHLRAPIAADPAPSPQAAGMSSQLTSDISVTLQTKRQLFSAGNQITTSCACTWKGPNRKLLTAYRLLAVEEVDLGKYGRAFDKEPMSVRNEWCSYRQLALDLQAALDRRIASSIQLDAEAAKPGFRPTPLQELATQIRRRDLMVLHQGAEICQAVAEQYGGLLFASDEQPRQGPSAGSSSSATALPAFKDLVIGLPAEEEDAAPSDLKGTNLSHVTLGEKSSSRMKCWLDSVDEFRENVWQQL